MSTLPVPSVLPPTLALRDMLRDTLGRDVTLGPSKPWAPTVSDPGAVGVYVDDGIRLRALITCNLGLSVALSAAIALIPARTAASCIQEGRLTADMAENLHEVLNILASLFNLPDRPHVRLFALHVPGRAPPANLSEQLRVLGRRVDLEVDVAGYGDGRLSLVLV